MPISVLLVLCLVGVGTAQYGSHPTYPTPRPFPIHNHQHPDEGGAGFQPQFHHGHHHHHDPHHHHHSGNIQRQGFNQVGAEGARGGCGHHHHNTNQDSTTHNHDGHYTTERLPDIDRRLGFQDGSNSQSLDYAEEVTHPSRSLAIPRDQQSFSALNARQILQHRGVQPGDISSRFGGEEELVQSVQPTSSFVRRPVVSGLSVK